MVYTSTLSTSWVIVTRWLIKIQICSFIRTTNKMSVLECGLYKSFHEYNFCGCFHIMQICVWANCEQTVVLIITLLIIANESSAWIKGYMLMSKCRKVEARVCVCVEKKNLTKIFFKNHWYQEHSHFNFIQNCFFYTANTTRLVTG